MNLSTALMNLLVHPVHKTPLIYNRETNQLQNQNSDERFTIKENVPLLVIQNSQEQLTQPIKSRVAGNTFDYKTHYQTDATAYDYFEKPESPIEREEIARLHQMIVARIPKKADWILDVGCGGAWLAQKLTPDGRKVISMDISDVNPIKAIQRFPSPTHFAVVADVFTLPFRENSIDCIVAAEIIEHVPDPKIFIQALLHVLKPGGTLIITTPYNEQIRTSLCIHCNCVTPQNAHLHSFTEHSIKRLIPQSAEKFFIYIFNSKLLVRAHLQKRLKFLPLSAWRVIDKTTIRLTSKKAYRLMVEIIK